MDRRLVVLKCHILGAVASHPPLAVFGPPTERPYFCSGGRITIRGSVFLSGRPYYHPGRPYFCSGGRITIRGVRISVWAARIASVNFAIALASLMKGNRGPIIILIVMAVGCVLPRCWTPASTRWLRQSEWLELYRVRGHTSVASSTVSAASLDFILAHWPACPHIHPSMRKQGCPGFLPDRISPQRTPRSSGSMEAFHFHPHSQRTNVSARLELLFSSMSIKVWGRANFL